MQTEPEPIISSPPISGVPTRPPEKNLLAPVWHTILIVALILLNSFAGSTKLPPVTSTYGRFVVYGGTFITELILFLLIWFGIRRKGARMRDLIGGRWKSPEDFLIDFGIALGFWLASALMLGGLKIALGLADLHHPEESLRQMKEAVAPLIPKNRAELGMYLALTVFAGLFEETIFRGYLQKQISAIAGNIWVGALVSAVLFGAAHGYQGVRLMVLIAVFGFLFSLLALWRKSLRPGMIAHAWQDAISGLILFFS